jgi:hypothetical protein
LGLAFMCLFARHSQANRFLISAAFLSNFPV